VLCLVFALISSALAWSALADGQAAEGSTDLGIRGEFVSLQLDLERARLYATDRGRFSTHGLVVISLPERREVRRIPISDPTSLALSPDGEILLVGATSGAVFVLNATSLDEIGEIWPTIWTEGVADLAFIDSQHVLASPTSSGSVGGYYPIVVLDLQSMSQEAVFDRAPWGFDLGTSVRADLARHRAYITQWMRVFVYDISSNLPTYMFDATSGDFTGAPTISGDGSLLFFPSGKVYLSSNLTFVRDLPYAGSPWLDEVTGDLYFAMGPHVDKLKLSDGSLEARWAYRGTTVRGPEMDLARGYAWVVSGDTQDDRSLHAVPLRTGLLDPWPVIGALWAVSPLEISVVASGEIDPSSLQLELDGAPVSGTFDVGNLTFEHGLSILLPDGPHQALATGMSLGGASLRLAWTFVLDSSGPEIKLDQDVFSDHNVVLHGRVSDLHFAEAWIEDANLTVAPDGSFEIPMFLTDEETPLTIRARDTLGNENSQSFIIHYRPSVLPVWLLAGVAALCAFLGVAVALLVWRRRNSVDHGRSESAEGQTPRRPV